MSESCGKNISHLLAAATYIDEVKKPKTGRKSVISLLNTRDTEDMELMFDENESGEKKVISHSGKKDPSPQMPNESEDDDISNDYDGEKTVAEQGRSYHQRLNHKDLEKHRRAHLRGCLEQLKELVPLGPDVQKHTTLGLLKKTRHILNQLEEKEKRLSVFKEQLKKENVFLKRKLEQTQQLPQNGEVSLGNNFLLSPPAIPTTSVSLAPPAKPHILRKRAQRNPVPEQMYNIIVPQTFISPQGNQSENFCLLIDKMEYIETPGCSGGGGIPIKYDQTIENGEAGAVMILCNGNYSPSTIHTQLIAHRDRNVKNERFYS